MSKPNTRAPKSSHLQLVGPPEAPEGPAAGGGPPGRGVLWGTVAAAACLALGGAWWMAGRPAVVTGMMQDLPAAEAEPHAEALLAFDAFAHADSQPNQARLLHEDDAVRTDDGYTFVLYNRTGGSAYFMLFGVDSQGTFFWFYPEGDTSKNHESLPLAATAVSSIPEGVTPGGVAGGAFHLAGLFTKKPVTLNEVQTAYSHGGFDALRHDIPDALLQIQALGMTK